MAHIVVVGAGGNIGSHLTPHLGRMPAVDAVTCIDSDTYEAANLRTQDISANDVGQSKAAVQAGRLSAINSELSVDAIQELVENVPLGRLRADVILACLDSRRARMTVNQAAWRLGVPWIDAGVNGSGRLVRVQLFAPAPGAPCLECAWDQSDYASVEHAHPCHDTSAPAVAATNAPSSLGALAAALQALECDTWLSGNRTQALVGRELLIDALHHRHFVTSSRLNPFCRMPDHGGWHITPGPVSSTASLQELFQFGETLSEGIGAVSFGVAGQMLVQGVACAACGRSKRTFCLERELRRSAPRCWRCRRSMAPHAFDLAETIPIHSVPPKTRARSLAQVGLRKGDVVAFAMPTAAAAYLEIGGRA